MYAQYTIRVNSENRDEIVESLKKIGIPTGIYYPKCFHEQPVFQYLGYKFGDFPESEKASREVLSLPMHTLLTIEEQDFVVESLYKIIKQ